MNNHIGYSEDYSDKNKVEENDKTHIWLDEMDVPRYDINDMELSLIGRIRKYKENIK